MDSQKTLTGRSAPYGQKKGASLPGTTKAHTEESAGTGLAKVPPVHYTQLTSLLSSLPPFSSLQQTGHKNTQV